MPSPDIPPAIPPARDAGPVTGDTRIQAIDTLRGVALFGILIMNIVAFGLGGAYFSPIIDGATQGANLAAYIIMDTFFEGSMRTIFSMLFGAGVILFTGKPEKDGIPTKTLYFRRTLLLIGFGLFDAYVLLWFGDILYAYGVTGLFLFWFRNQSPARLLALGSVLILAFATLHFIESQELAKMSRQVVVANAVPAQQRSFEQEATLAAWAQFQADNFELPPERETATPEIVNAPVSRLESYWHTFKQVAPINLYLQTWDYVTHMFWDVLAMMLLGMALFKWRVFDASLSFQSYGLMTVLGLGVGLSVNYYEVSAFIDSGFSTHLNMSALRPTYDIGRFFTAMGYIGLVMLICKARLLPRLRFSLAAVGQMALSNYLSHSLICAFIFYDFGFGLLEKLERYELYYIVAAIWIFQLISSPLWLKYFRFGPCEWLWRSMTYKRKQPFTIPRSD